MPTDCISYQQSGYFSALINDYLNEKPELKALYHRFPNLENFKLQLEEKRNNFNYKDNGKLKREDLVSVLEKQYQSIVASETTLNNIKLLNNLNKFQNNGNN